MANISPARKRRLTKIRRTIAEKRVTRLTVHRTSQHIYAQVISADGAKVIACASSLEKDIRSLSEAKTDIAKKVGNLVAERAVAKGVNKVAFDRSGFRYHGRIKALADSAREGGLEF